MWPWTLLPNLAQWFKRRLKFMWMQTCKMMTIAMSVTNDHRYLLLVLSDIHSFPHSWLITGFVTKVTLQVPLVEQELLTLLELVAFSWVRFAGSLLFCVMFCRSLFVLLTIVSCVVWFADSDYPFDIFLIWTNKEEILSTKSCLHDMVSMWRFV